MAVNPDVEKSSPVDTRPETIDAASVSDRAEAGDLDLVQVESAFEPPDGGLVAWTQVLAGNLVNCISWGYPATFGVYQLYYKDWLQLPQAQISWIGSVQLFLTFVSCTFSGRLADAGYVKTTLAAGSFMVIFGTFMTSISTQYWQIFLAQGVCTGLGLGIMFMPPLTVINSYFKRKRALALAIAATGTGIGSVIFPATIQYLIPKVGFGWAVRVSAFVALVICVIATTVLKPRLKPRRTGPWVEWSAFTEGPYVLFTMGAFFTFWALYFGFFYINVYARNVVGFDTVSSVQLLLIMNGMSVPSRPITGFLADYVLGPVNTFTIMTMILAGMVFAWIGIHTRTDMYVFAVFFGLANGAAQGVYVGALASLTKDPRKMGTRFGMVCTIVAFATLAGPPTAGAIIDKDNGRYIWAQVWAGIVIALGSCTIGMARVKSTGWRLKVKI
ncbi:MFS general substrate transporter [Coniochaeta sp. PMI_546]|nr:MFS general substrate transporter [Coniochaeta sp. PMI_546]